MGLLNQLNRGCSFNHFVNLFGDTGVAGVDIHRFDDDGNVVEHWDTLQFAAPRRIPRHGPG